MRDLFIDSRRASRTLASSKSRDVLQVSLRQKQFITRNVIKQKVCYTQNSVEKVTDVFFGILISSETWAEMRIKCRAVTVEKLWSQNNRIYNDGE